MESAFDVRKNRLISTDEGITGYSYYRCPACGDRVFFRASSRYSNRIAHFAHQSGSQNRDCELFHASEYQWEPGRQRLEQFISLPQLQEISHLHSPKFVLREEDLNSYELYLFLPRVQGFNPWDGTLSIRGKYGEVNLTFQQLANKDRLIAINPTDGPFIDRLGLIDERYWEAISQQVSLLRADAKNYFSYNPLGGRIFTPQERLSWGEKYYLLSTTKSLGPIPSSIRGFEVKSNEWQEGWHICEVELPPEKNFLLQVEKQDLKYWLEREIDPQPPYANLLYPYPTSITGDGALVLRSDERHLVEMSLSRPGNLLVRSEGHEWLDYGYCEEDIAIEDLPDGICEFELDGHKILRLYFKSDEIFTPTGVRVLRNDGVYELFDSHAYGILKDNQGQFQISVPDLRILKLILVNGDKYLSTDELQMAIAGEVADPRHDLLIDAENFGWLFLEKRVLSNQAPDDLPKNLQIKIEWLMALPNSNRADYVTFPNQLKTDGRVSDLSHKRWDRKYLPQIIYIFSQLKKLGY